MTCFPRMIDDDTAFSPSSKSAAAPRSRPRVLPVVGRIGVEIAISVIERLDVWKHGLCQPAALDFLAAERAFEDVGKLAQGGIAVEASELAVLIDDLAGDDHRLDPLRLGPLDHRVEHGCFGIEIGIADLLSLSRFRNIDRKST